MNFLTELETMALNVSREATTISASDVERWTKLFGFTQSEAHAAIEAHREDISRIRISDELWDAIESEKHVEGHNRESYEYSLSHPREIESCRDNTSKALVERGTFIVKLGGPLSTPGKIQEAAALTRIPVLADGAGEFGQAQFCQIDGTAKRQLVSWLAKHHRGFQPTIIRLSKAQKELCTHTQAPMLGKDFTLPQYRAISADFAPSPAQNQYPVWYFFYGTLADTDLLARQLGREKIPLFVPAYVVGGRIRTWAGKYKALVDALGEEVVVAGSAFRVETRAEEDALRFYETEKYEVVRCRITTSSGGINGLTFRFSGSERELD